MVRGVSFGRVGDFETEEVDADAQVDRDEAASRPFSPAETEVAAELRSGAPPGWMSHPLDDDLFHYWDGERWTGHERRYVRTSLGAMTIQSPPGYWDEPEYRFGADGWGFEFGGGIARP
jgi:hypothetical protein